MRLPPKWLLIRIAIFGPLLIFFGWKAFERLGAQRDAESSALEAKEAREHLKKKATSSIKLDNGHEMPILELTAKEFEQEFGIKPNMENFRERPEAAPEPEPEPAPEPLAPAVNPALGIPEGNPL